MKKVLVFTAQIITTALCMWFVMWLFDMAFNHNASFSYENLVQSFVFAIIFVPYSRWSARRRAKK